MYQWEIFISLEVGSWVSLLVFGVLRYLFDKRHLSNYFIALFILLIVLEAVIGLLIYQQTGVISNFQVIIIIFVLYAVTFGVSDFKKLDRWMRNKIGGWRGVDLLSDRDVEIMSRNKDPKYIAKKYRRSSMIHLTAFLIVQAGFWIYGLNDLDDVLYYLKDLSWVGNEDASGTPYVNDTLYGISMVWGIVFIVDFIYSWSYTIFPSGAKE